MKGNTKIIIIEEGEEGDPTKNHKMRNLNNPLLLLLKILPMMVKN